MGPARENDVKRILLVSAAAWAACLSNESNAQDVQPTSLAELLRHADQHAPSLRIARAELGRVRADEGAAAPLLPRNPVLRAAVGPRLGEEGSDFDVQVGLQQALEIGGERGHRRRVARRARERLDAELEAVRWELHRRVRASFRLATVAHARSNVATRLEEFQQRLAEVAEARVSAGDASPLVSSLAGVEVVQARQSVLDAEQALRSLEFRLAELAGWDGAVSLRQAPLDAPRALASVSRLLALAREHQPALAALAAAVREAEARRALAGRDGWPEPSLGVRFVREGAPDDGGREWLVLGTLTMALPLWQRNQEAVGRTEGNLDVARAQHDAVTATLEVRVRRLASEVSTAAARVHAYTSEVIPRFRQHLAQLQRAFELGEIDFLRLSLAREQILSAQLDALDAHATYYTAVADLEALLGAEAWASNGEVTP